ncbi:MAG: hypothetical protein JWM78_1724 [Verrucomicrobiaceae bacterium]|nr:hypothetical protein [Verrucomicrobiaceae bacterium]
MTSLREWQIEFMHALTQGEQSLPVQLHAVDDGGERLAIYRNNWRGNLCGALRIAYPVIEKLVGEEFFSYSAHCFIDAQPSRSANLDDYGREFPHFLRAFAPASTLPYLGDVAALELAIDDVNASADEAAFVTLQSPYPLLKIWRSNQPHWAGDMTINLDDGPDFLTIRREQGEVIIESMSLPD